MPDEHTAPSQKLGKYEIRREGHRATVRVDAYPDRVFAARVRTVAAVAQQADWFSSDVKLYTTTVLITESVAGLKPDMNAEVTIHVQSAGEHVLTEHSAQTGVTGLECEHRLDENVQRPGGNGTKGEAFHGDPADVAGLGPTGEPDTSRQWQSEFDGQLRVDRGGGGTSVEQKRIGTHTVHADRDDDEGAMHGLEVNGVVGGLGDADEAKQEECQKDGRSKRERVRAGLTW